MFATITLLLSEGGGFPRSSRSTGLGFSGQRRSVLTAFSFLPSAIDAIFMSTFAGGNVHAGGIGVVPNGWLFSFIPISKRKVVTSCLCVFLQLLKPP